VTRIAEQEGTAVAAINHQRGIPMRKLLVAIAITISIARPNLSLSG
jgi:hypothetical protein